MIDREKIVAALENCSDPAGKCKDCPYEECERFEKSISEYPDELIRKAVELLKEQEPRVLTLGDVIACSSRKEWLWFEENAYGYVEESSMICAQIYSFGDSWIAVDVPSQTHDETIEFDNENYGKIWRCWSAKPTDEQREAVPWED